MQLIEYIDLHYNGNISALAREIGRSPQVVHNWIKQGYIVIDRMIHKPSLKLPVPLNYPHQYRKMSPRKTGELFIQYPRGDKYSDN